MSNNNNNNNNHDNNDAPNKVTTTRTVLRIKRRRNEDPLPYLRLEGLDGSIKRKRRSNNAEDQQLSELLQNNALLNNNAQNNNTNHPTAATAPTPPPLKPTNHNTSAIWKRMRPNTENDESLQQQPQQTYRVVDAVLEDDDDDDNVVVAPPTATKRRKLTVLETKHETELLPQQKNNTVTTKKKKKQPLKVLDPWSRMVDDSLQEVHQGTKTAQQHYALITKDPRLAYSKKWLQWCHSAGGNLLHACAIWNEVELASDLVQLDNLTLTEAVDGDGKTPYELAQLAGHASICEILEAFGGDTSNYVYDIFYLEQEGGGGNHHHDGSTATRSPQEDDKTTMYQENPIATAELTSGVGYWTPFGELVLEAQKDHSSFNHHFDDEDGEEIDSNCEEYGANDYPDDDEVDDDDDSWAEAFTPDQGFRNYDVDNDYYAYDAAHDYDDM